jgi:hypothetical protein
MEITKYAENLPHTCPDFVEHPHRVERIIGETRIKSGCYQCQEASASEDQGTTQIAFALLDLGIPCTIHQTGGFTMCVYIKTGKTSYIYANDEGFSFYKDAEDDGGAHYEFSESENTAQAKAQTISETMKGANITALDF